jgi:hypothetical protein
MEILFTWGTLSALIIAISGIPYMWGIYRRTVKKPVTSSWGIWSVVGFLFLITYYDAGARMDTTLPAAWAGFISPVIIFTLSLRYGEKSWSNLESWCVGICLVTIVLWQYLESAIVGILGAIIADAMGVIPQMKKSWNDPHDEPWFPWVAFCIGSAINILGIENWEPGQYIFPVYMTIGSFLIAVPVVVFRMRKQPA